MIIPIIIVKIYESLHDSLSNLRSNLSVLVTDNKISKNKVLCNSV